MKHLLILGVALLCLAVFGTDAEADATDNAVVTNAFEHLSALHSFREIGSYVLLGHEETICLQWCKTPSQLRTTTSMKYYPVNSFVVWTPTRSYMRVTDTSRKEKIWKTWKTRRADRATLKEGIDYRKELDLDRCDFTYRGLVQLGGTQCRCYTFRGRPGNRFTRRGKVCIGAADDLPRRLESAASQLGPYRMTWDNFDGPVSAELPAVKATDPPQPKEP